MIESLASNSTTDDSREIDIARNKFQIQTISHFRGEPRCTFDSLSFGVDMLGEQRGPGDAIDKALTPLGIALQTNRHRQFSPQLVVNGGCLH